jgi:hypothetical protein
MLDLTFRCFSSARWLTVAKARGILDADGKPNEGFVVHEIGQMPIYGDQDFEVDVQYDQPNGDPPIFVKRTETRRVLLDIDTWHWVNVRVHTKAREADDDTVFTGETDTVPFTKSKIVRWIRENSTAKTLRYRGQDIRVYENGSAANRIQLIDPRDYQRLATWFFA